MKISRTIWIAIAVLLLWLLLSWLLGGWIGMHAPGLYYLRGGLSILGIIGFVGYLLLRPKVEAGAQPGVSSGEMDDNFNEASKRLQSSGVKRLATLPTVFFLGDSDSAKTSVIAKSDIAQLLAGQAQQDVAIVPTRAVNFWIAKGSTVFVDPAGAILGDPENRQRLFRRFSAVALRSVMGSRAMPARSVVVTVSCETLLQSGGADAMAAKARQFQTILGELAQEIGSTFPVYVLFTKADKTAYFRDFVENLSEQEAAEVFGVTLPLETQHGVYSEQQANRVNNAFQQLYYWLADQRPAFLTREHKPAALPNIYEFPREFNKVRGLLTSFLVDLCRPSQLGISPFLRGFYFTGIRAVTVNDVAPAPLHVAGADDSGIDAGATRMFNIPPRGAVPLVADVRAGGARKIAQWIYLSQFLPGVVLADHTAVSVGGSNVKLNVARRALWAGAAAVALLMAIWWTISYSKNYALIHGALDAAQGAPPVASLDALQRLTKVKDTLETLNYFQEHGRPLSYGGFLYTGDDAAKSVSETYYGLFRRLLLAPTQENLVQVCRQPSDAQPQNFLYDDLKSYLVTTQYHDKSVPEFLTPALLLHWKAGRTVGPEEEKLAQLNFDFYSRELPNKNEYWPPKPPDGDAVRNCRDYLNKQGQTDPVYRRMLADAGAHEPPLIFNDLYAGTEPYVTNRYPVDPGYKKTGFERFQNLLKNIRGYVNGEQWVLEPPSGDSLDQGKLSLALRQMYKDNFIKTWLDYLKATNVHKAGNIADAVAKLDKLTSDRSALIEALCLASENTDVPDKEIGDAFRSVHVATPPGCSQAPVSGSGHDYLEKLLGLLEALKAVDPKKQDTYDVAQHAGESTDSQIKAIALNFAPPTDDSVTKILKDAVFHIGPAPTPPEASDAAKGACAAIQPTLSKYPFNPASTADASMSDVDTFLKKPDGALWKLVSNPAIAALVTQYGDTFTAKTSGQDQARPSFVSFLNRAAALSHLLYGQNGQAAGFKFTLNPVPEPDVVEHVVLNINGSIQSTDAHGTPTKEFEWPGSGEGVNLEVRFVGGSDLNVARHPGLWGVWHFMDSGAEVKPNQFEWTLKQGSAKVKTSHGDDVVVRFTIDPSKASVLRPRYFAITCVPRAN